MSRARLPAPLGVESRLLLVLPMHLLVLPMHQQHDCGCCCVLRVGGDDQAEGGGGEVRWSR